MNSAISDEILLATLKAWHLPEPLTVQRLPGGFTSEVWLVEAKGERFIAKYAYQSREDFEGGLYAAELAEQNGITSGAPLRTRDGALSILVEGPHGQSEPFALLRFVPGEPLHPSEPDAASLYGYLLGRMQRIFLDELGERDIANLFDFILEEDPAVAAQPGLVGLIHQTVEATRHYESQHPVTYGVIWGDRMEIVREKETGRVGVIDWGTIEYGPLLFDVALSTLWLFPEGSAAHEEFLRAYLVETPISESELAGLTYYKAILWARQARYFAYRVAANVMLGDSNPDGNRENLTHSRQELEHLLAIL
ncbi:MAG TPA: phosphotransferase [Ktedonobacteraceae bacterium]|nr:phosphotransferase [Ktedonobacteraceae bacterium]